MFDQIASVWIEAVTLLLSTFFLLLLTVALIWYISYYQAKIKTFIYSFFII